MAACIAAASVLAKVTRDRLMVAMDADYPAYDFKTHKGYITDVHTAALTARFGLHTRVLGRTLWVPNTHGPWPLRTARVTHLEDTLVAAAGLPGVTGRPPDSVLFSTGVRTVFGLPRRL